MQFHSCVTGHRALPIVFCTAHAYTEPYVKLQGTGRGFPPALFVSWMGFYSEVSALAALPRSTSTCCVKCAGVAVFSQHCVWPNLGKAKWRNL